MFCTSEFVLRHDLRGQADWFAAVSRGGGGEAGLPLLAIKPKGGWGEAQVGGFASKRKILLF